MGVMSDPVEMSASRESPLPRKVVFAGPLPPPGHGMANVNRDMVAMIAEHTDITALGVQPPALRRGLGYHLGKAWRAVIATLGIARARLSGARVFYGSVDDGLGGLWTVLFTSIARVSGLQVFLHHHSYKYILERTAIMRALVFAAGPRAHHVMLCDEMIAAFSAVYPGARNFCAAPNSVAKPARPMAGRKPNATGVTIGLLSNLTREKGLRSFIELVQQCEDPELQGILAGPIPDPEDEEFVRHSLVRLGGRLEWLGPVADEAKEAFFERLDLFVFPTTYTTETLSLVLLEALVRGVPCIAPRRGCICVFEKLSSIDVVPLDSDFGAAAQREIAQMLENPALIEAKKAEAQQEGRELNRAHELAQAMLVEKICGNPDGKWKA